MPEARMHDGSAVDVEITGGGPAVLLPVNPRPVEGPRAEELRAWGADPALGRSLIDGLADEFRVIAFDYEGHVFAHPKPDTLTPDTVTADILAVADAAGAPRFAYYGYSWLALSGLQLALRSDRIAALAMGGFPPLDGPYDEMLRVTTATHAMAARHGSSVPAGSPATAGRPEEVGGPTVPEEVDWSTVEVTLTEPQTRQFVTLYRALQGFDDHAAQARLTCPRLCFAGSADMIEYDERWGGVRVSMVDPLVHRRHDLVRLGWQVRVLEGLDHTGAMQVGAVLPVLRPWLETALGVEPSTTR